MIYTVIHAIKMKGDIFNNSDIIFLLHTDKYYRIPQRIHLYVIRHPAKMHIMVDY